MMGEAGLPNKDYVKFAMLMFRGFTGYQGVSTGAETTSLASNTMVLMNLTQKPNTSRYLYFLFRPQTSDLHQM